MYIFWPILDYSREFSFNDSLLVGDSEWDIQIYKTEIWSFIIRADDWRIH